VKLIVELEKLIALQQSLFQAQLLREDVARLRRLDALAAEAADIEAFRKAGMRLGWTQGDARTHELRGPLLALLDAVYAGDEALIAQSWEALHRARMEKLVGCLSTPVPKPLD
jgi:hypothetical protein